MKRKHSRLTYFCSLDLVVKVKTSLANSVDPDETQEIVISHQELHYLISQ